MNIVQFLNEKTVHDLRLPLSIAEKLIAANLIELTNIYAAFKGYQVLGVWFAGSLNTDELNIVIRQVDALLIEAGLKKPAKPASVPTPVSRPVSKSASQVRTSKKAVSANRSQTLPEKQEVPQQTTREPISRPLMNETTPPARLEKPNILHSEEVEITGLARMEKSFAPMIYQVSLVGEVSISQATLAELSLEFRRLFYNQSHQNAIESIINFYPASFLLFLVGHGIYGYQGGDYWEAVEKALDCRVDQVALGQLFERLLRWFRLPLFPELQERAFRYVSPILAHGGIPINSLQDFFSQIVYPCATRPQLVGLDGQELVDEVLNSFANRNIDKPIFHFLEYCGQAAINLLERSRGAFLIWRKIRTDLTADETGLPVRISVKAHSLNGGCRTVFERRRLTEKFYIKCATSSAAI